MNRRVQPPNDPDILGAAAALRRAAKRALKLGIETGTPVYVIKRGKIVDIAAEHRGKRKRKGRK
jgi:hypothetical protein